MVRLTSTMNISLRSHNLHIFISSTALILLGRTSPIFAQYVDRTSVRNSAVSGDEENALVGSVDPNGRVSGTGTVLNPASTRSAFLKWKAALESASLGQEKSQAVEDRTTELAGNPPWTAPVSVSSANVGEQAVASVVPTAIADEDIMFQITGGSGNLPLNGAYTVVHGERRTCAIVDVSGSVASGQYGTFGYSTVDANTAHISYSLNTGSLDLTLTFTSSSSGNFVCTQGGSTQSGTFNIATPLFHYVMLEESGSGNWIAKGTTHLYFTESGSFVFLDSISSQGDGVGNGESGTYTYSDLAQTFQCIGLYNMNTKFSFAILYTGGDSGVFSLTASNGNSAGTFIVPAAFAPASIANSTETFVVLDGLGHDYLATDGGGTTAWGNNGSWANLSNYGSVAQGLNGSFTYVRESSCVGEVQFGSADSYHYMFFTEPGSGYWIAVYNGDADWGTFTFGTNMPPTGTVVEPAPDIAVTGSSTVTMQVNAVSSTGIVLYQWGLNGVAIAGATGSIYTIGSVSSSNQGKYSVTLSNSNGSVTLDAGTLTVNGAPNISVDLVDPNSGDPVFSLMQGANKLITDSHQLATSGKICQGVCADSVTLILLRANVPAGTPKVTFSVAQSDYSSATDGCLNSRTGPMGPGQQSISVSTTVNSDGTFAYVVYQAPSLFYSGNASDIGSPTRSVVVSVSTSSSLIQQAILIHRPPVLLIHGLWSDAGAWNQSPIEQDGRFFWFAANYVRTNAANFSTNDQAVGQWVDSTINCAHIEGYAATQVDVIGHSMGGILAREFVQDSRYDSNKNFAMGAFHSITTLNTPHLGSLLANVIKERGEPNPFFSYLCNLAGMPINKGAIDDLCIGSAALSSIPETNVPAIALCGDPPLPVVSNRNISGMYAVLDLLLGVNEAELAMGIEANDGVVTVVSQQGGITPLSFGLSTHTFTDEYGSDHLDCTGDASYYSDPQYGVFDELTSGCPNYSLVPGEFPSPSVIWSASASNGLTMARALSVGPRALPMATSGSLVMSTGSTDVTPGSTISISVSYSGSALVVRALVVGPGATAAVSNGTAELQIPTDFVGAYAINACAVLDDGTVLQSNSISVNVGPFASLVAIKLNPANVFLTSVGNSQTLYVLGTFADGSSLNLHDLSALSFASSAPSVATVDSNGTITAVRDGTATITVSVGVVKSTAKVRVDAEYGTQVQVTGVTLPVVTSNPAPELVEASQNANFSVNATGGSLSYQWYFNGRPINLAQQSSYSVTGATVANAGPYTVAVSNAAGLVMSNAATLSVETQPMITGRPTTQTVIPAANATFKVSVLSIGPSYQWQRMPIGGSTWANFADSATYSGTSTSSLTVNAATTGMSGDAFRCVINDSLGVVTSSAADLVVAEPMLVTTVAGSSQTIGNIDGVGTAARFNNPADLTVDVSGNVYVADANNNTIRRISPSGVVATIAGQGSVSGSADGTGTAALFNHPSGMTLDSSGNLYVADTRNDLIRKIASSGAVSTIAGIPGTAGSSDGTTTNATFNAPSDVAIDTGGNLYISDTLNNTIRRIGSDGTVRTLAGRAGTAGNVDGTGTAALFFAPQGITIDTSGNLYVADTNNQTIRKVTPGGVVTTLAGFAGTFGASDGMGSAARFFNPSDLTIDTLGKLYVVDTDNHTLRMIDTNGVVATVAGIAGQNGSTDGTGSGAKFNFPTGVRCGTGGALFIADTSNETIREAMSLSSPVITTQPQGQTVIAGGSASFSVVATGIPAPTYQWYFGTTAINGATSSTYSLSNVQSANAGNYTVAVSNSLGSVTSNQAALTVNAVTPPPGGGGGGSSGGGGGGGAPSTWFYGALFLLAAGRVVQGRARIKGISDS